MYTTENGREVVVKLLLKTGKADVDSKDNEGRTLLMFAAEHSHEVVVKLLQASIITLLCSFYKLSLITHNPCYREESLRACETHVF